MKLAVLSSLVLSLASVTAQDEQVIIVTGGWNGFDVLNSTEVVGNTACMLPDLPENRELHSTAFTADGLLLTIGGDVLSVLVMDFASQTWNSHSYLDTDRNLASAVTMPDGIYLLGGSEGENQKDTSSFLPTGSSQWETGPSLPSALDSSCVVQTSDSSFVMIGGKPDSKQVAEYNTATGEWNSWPSLSHGRSAHACAKLGDKIVFAGGLDEEGYYLASTGIIDITGDRMERPGGDLSVERIFFGMFAMGDQIVALGGEYGADYWDTIEEWDDGMEQWVGSNDKLEMGRTYFGSTLAPASVCGQQ